MTPAASMRARSGRVPRRRRGRVGWSLLLLATSVGWLAPPVARAAQVEEYDLKAVFLYNFAQFVDWPAAAFSAPDAPFVIGVLQPDPFDGALEDVVRDEVVNGHRFSVQRYRSPDEIGSCHILFVPARATAEIAAQLPQLAERHILTVSEGDDLLSRGAAVEFRMENQKVRIRINLAAARAANLTISSKLLRAAELVPAPDATLLPR